MSIAAPRPLKKSDDSANAPWGKSNASELLKCVTPETMTQTTANITPSHKYSVMRLMIVTLRYRRNTEIRQVPIATNVAGVKVKRAHSEDGLPFHNREVNAGENEEAYCTTPIDPDAV